MPKIKFSVGKLSGPSGTERGIGLGLGLLLSNRVKYMYSQRSGPPGAPILRLRHDTSMIDTACLVDHC